MSNQIISTVEYYNQVSPIGKPMLDLLKVNCKKSCIDTINHMDSQKCYNFCYLNGIKYLWRLGRKTEDCSEDIRKAIEYFEWSITNELNPLSCIKKRRVHIVISKLKEMK